MKITYLIAGAAALSIAAPAAAQMVTAANPQSIVRVLQAEGFQAKVGTDKEGDPQITSSASGTTFTIRFYGCEAGKNCVSVQFTAGYNTPDGKGPSLVTINQWNETKRYAQASLDKEGDPWVSMDVFTATSGISTEVFKGDLDMWTDQMGAFEKFIGWSN